MFVLLAKEFAYVTHNVEGGSEVHFIESAGQLGQLMTSTRGGFTLEPSFQIMQDSKIYVAMEFSSHNLEKRQKWCRSTNRQKWIKSREYCMSHHKLAPTKCNTSNFLVRVEHRGGAERKRGVLGGAARGD